MRSQSIRRIRGSFRTPAVQSTSSGKHGRAEVARLATPFSVQADEALRRERSILSCINQVRQLAWDGRGKKPAAARQRVLNVYGPNRVRARFPWHPRERIAGVALVGPLLFKLQRSCLSGTCRTFLVQCFDSNKRKPGGVQRYELLYDCDVVVVDPSRRP